MNTDILPSAGEIWKGPGGRFVVVTPAEHFVTRDALVVYKAADGSSPCYVCTLEAFLEFWKPTGEREADTCTGVSDEACEKTHNESCNESCGSTCEESGKTLSPEAEQFKNQVFGKSQEVVFSEEDFLKNFFAIEDSQARIEIINENWRYITDRIIDNIGIVMDMPIRKGTIDERLVELTGCLRTRARFEGQRSRLRRDY